MFGKWLNRRFTRINGFHGFSVQRFYRFLIRVIRIIRLIRDSDKRSTEQSNMPDITEDCLAKTVQPLDHGIRVLHNSIA